MLNKEFYEAICSGHLTTVKTFIASGINIRAHDEWGDTPLHIAARRGHLHIVQCLLENGADVLARNKFDETPLHGAAKFSCMTVFQCLVGSGADITACNNMKDTVLHVAAFRGHLTIVQFLRGRGKDILSMRNNAGNTPLHIAALRGHLEVLGALVAQGADIHSLNNGNKSPIVLAFEAGYHPIVHYLQEQGAVLPDYLTQEEDEFDIDDIMMSINNGMNINDNQSVHTVTVHVGVARAATALKAHYGSSHIEQAITELIAYVNALPYNADVHDIKDPYGAAKRCLPYLLSLDFVEGRSGITLREAMAFVWIGLHDPIERQRRQVEQGLTQGEKQEGLEEQKALWEKREAELLQEIISQWLYEIQRGYNLSKTSIDNGKPDGFTCVSGCFNKTIYVLNRRHALVNIEYVTEASISAKAVILANECFDKLSAAERMQYAQASHHEISSTLVALLQRELPPLLHAEFDSFKAEGVDVDKAIEDVVNTMGDISIKALEAMLAPSPAPILHAHRWVDPPSSSSSTDCFCETVNRLSLN